MRIDMRKPGIAQTITPPAERTHSSAPTTENNNLNPNSGSFLISGIRLPPPSRPKELKSIYSSLYPLRLFPPATRLHARSQNLIFRAVPGSARGAEDADLIARVRKGDVEGFNLLVSRWEKRVFNYLLRLTGNPDDSLDLSQDVFLKAYQNIRKLDDTARFGPWLFRIAHNEAYSGFRKRRPEVAAPEFETDGNGRLVFRSPDRARHRYRSFAGGFRRARQAQPGTARGRRSQDLSGLQIRRNGGDSGMPGFHRQIAALYRARTAQNRTGARQYKRYPMNTEENPACDRRISFRDYAFDELAPRNAAAWSSTSGNAPPARRELDQLRLTTAALRVLPDRGSAAPHRLRLGSHPRTGWLERLLEFGRAPRFRFRLRAGRRSLVRGLASCNLPRSSPPVSRRVRRPHSGGRE